MSYVVEFGGERLDRIARKMLQTELDGAVEALLEANPGLSAICEEGFVPAGTVIVAPERFVATRPQTSFVLAWE